MIVRAEIVLVTGEIQSGKTSLCLNLYKEARAEGYSVAGLISPAIFEKGEKVAINVLDLKSGIQKRLAERNAGQPSALKTQHWSFFQEIIKWGNDKLKRAVPCDLLVIDELGPLEFHRNQGWVNGFSSLESGAYQAAVVVIRPSLISEAVLRWDSARVFDLSDPGMGTVTGKELFEALLAE